MDAETAAWLENSRCEAVELIKRDKIIQPGLTKLRAAIGKMGQDDQTVALATLSCTGGISPWRCSLVSPLLRDRDVTVALEKMLDYIGRLGPAWSLYVFEELLGPDATTTSEQPSKLPGETRRVTGDEAAYPL